MSSTTVLCYGCRQFKKPVAFSSEQLALTTKERRCNFCLGMLNRVTATGKKRKNSDNKYSEQAITEFLTNLK